MAAVSLSFAGVPLPRLRAHPDRARSKPLNVPASFASAAVPRTPAREAGDGSPHAQVAQAAPVALLTRVSEGCLLYTSPSPRDQRGSRMPSSA